MTTNEGTAESPEDRYAAPIREYEEARVDWSTLRDVPETVWLCEPLIRSNTISSLTAAANTGKSLLLLDAALGIATGKPCLLKGETEPKRVLYLDFERGKRALRHRLDQFGVAHASGERLENLDYWCNPRLPSLHTREGGEAVEAIAKHFGAEVVIIDTISTAVRGDENSATTYTSFSHYTVGPLLSAGMAIVWADHTGHRHADRERGSSAKVGIPDLAHVLSLRPRGTRDDLVLTTRKENENSGRPAVEYIKRCDEPTLHHTVEGALTPRQREVRDQVLALGPRAWTVRDMKTAFDCNQDVAKAVIAHLESRDLEVAA